MKNSQPPKEAKLTRTFPFSNAWLSWREVNDYYNWRWKYFSLSNFLHLGDKLMLRIALPGALFRPGVFKKEKRNGKREWIFPGRSSATEAATRPERVRAQEQSNGRTGHGKLPSTSCNFCETCTRTAVVCLGTRPKCNLTLVTIRYSVHSAFITARCVFVGLKC